MAFLRHYFSFPCFALICSAAVADVDEAMNLVQRDLSFTSESNLDGGEKMLVEYVTEVDLSTCSLRISKQTRVDGELKSGKTNFIPLPDIDESRLDEAPEFLTSSNQTSDGGIFFHSRGLGFQQKKIGYGISANLHSAMIRAAIYEECTGEVCRSSERVLFTFLWPAHDLASAKMAIAELRSSCFNQ